MPVLNSKQTVSWMVIGASVVVVDDDADPHYQVNYRKYV